MDIKNRSFLRLKKPSLFNNKGLMAGRTVKIIVAIFGLIVVIFLATYLILIFMAPTTDSLCTTGNNIRHAASLDTINIYFWPQLCERQAVDITSDRWDLCPSLYAKYAEESDKNNKLVLIRECAIQQIAELFRRCWVNSGSGNLDPGNYECFHFNIKNYPVGADTDVTFQEVIEFMKTNNVSGTGTLYKDVVDVRQMSMGDIRYDGGWLQWGGGGVINSGEVWIIRFDDTSLSSNDILNLYRADQVTVDETPENCLKDPECFDICGVWGEGYSDDLGETCYADSSCSAGCVEEEVEEKE